MVTISYTLVISVIIARKYVLRDTGDTTRLKNADTLFDSIDTILSVSQDIMFSQKIITLTQFQSTALTPLVYLLILVVGAIGAPLLVVYDEVGNDIMT